MLGFVGLTGVGAAYGLTARTFAAAEPGLSSLDTTTIFGPQQFQAAPNTAIHVEQFTEARDLQATYLLQVENGNADGSARVSDAQVWLNGTQILSGSDFSTSVYQLTRGLSIQDGGNILEVRVKGQNSRHVTVRVLRIQSEPRGIYDRRFQKETTGPESFTDQVVVPSGFGPPYWVNVFEGEQGGTYMPTGMAVIVNGDTVYPPPPCPVGHDCPHVVEPYFDVDLLPVNELEVWMAGPVGASARVRFIATDTTPPVLTLISPEEGLITSAGEVEVAGTVEDDSPPVTLTINGDTVPVDGSGAFSSLVVLPNEGENAIHLVAEDAATYMDGQVICAEFPGPLPEDPPEPDPVDPEFPGPSPTEPECGLTNVTELTRVVIRDTEPPVLSVVSPEDGLVTDHGSVEVIGTVQDLTEVAVNVNGMPLVVDGSGGFIGEVLLDEGENFLTITATDQAGNSTSTIRHVTRTGGDPDPPVLVVTEPVEGLVTTAGTVWVRGTVTGASAVALTVNGASVPVEVDDSFEHEVALVVGPNSIVVVATDAAEKVTTVMRNVTREAEGDPDLPPDPSTVAPELDRTVSTTLHAATDFLYTGDDPIQTGVAPGTISPVRASVIRGRVLTREDQPLPGVTITVLNHGEFGQTKSRADGAFDLAVNGGGQLTLNYEKDGYLPAQRQVRAPWQDWAHIDDVVLIGVDPQATVVSPATATEIQVARGSVAMDEDGSRQATVLFKPGTQAEMVLPDGSREPLSTFTVRATEYTVGEDGPQAMPGPLPPTTAYTYAVELSVDQAVASGATGVEFDAPVPFYVENFLGFPVGLPVPVGWWDRDRGAWVPAPDGRIIEIVGVNAGLAEIDTDGDGVADDESTLAALGIDAAERAHLAGLYTVGTSLWRAETTHFSAIDLNFPFGRPLDAIRALLDWLNDLLDRPCTSGGSIIECQNQVLGERLGLVGTGFALNYRSDRVPGRTAGRTLEVPISGDSLPESLLRIELVVDVAGRQFTETFAAEPNQTFTFEWDGLDAFGREVQGSQPARVRVGYAYPFFYSVPPSTAQSFGLTCTGSGGTSWMQACVIPTSVTSRARQEDILWQERVATLGTWDATTVGLGGWTLDPHHYYDPVGQVLYLGTGERRSATNLNQSIVTMAGTGVGGFAGDGGPAAAARINGATDVHSAPDRNLYIADWGNHRIRQVDTAGIITTVAGSGIAGFAGDGGPATLARLRNPHGVNLGPDGSIYIADQENHRIRRVSPDGIITTVAGIGVAGSTGDGGPATEARINLPRFVAVAGDGSLYIVELNGHRIRRVSPSGVINTIAGTGVAGFTGDGGAAVQARLRNPDGIAVAEDGTVYVTDQGNHRIRRIDPAGIITTIAGTGTAGFLGEGTPAVEARLNRPEGIHLAADGSLYIADASNNRIRVISPDGIIRTVAGRETAGFSGDGGAGPQAQLNHPHGVTVAQDGSVYVADVSNNRVRRINTVLPGFSDAEIAIAADDGTEIYRFDASGRHLTTLNALTGATVFSYAYDAAGRLLTVTDGDGNVTTAERAGDGMPEAIRGPFGQRTTLAMDPDGYLALATNPAGEAVQLAYAAGGLLREVRDPRGNSSEYIYGEGGRLVRAEDASGGFKTLARLQSANALEVALETGLGRTTTYGVDALPTGAQRWTNTDPAGHAVITTLGPDGSTTSVLPDGASASVLEAPDPRFGLQVPITGRMTLATPEGASFDVTGGRRVTLTDPGNPLALAMQVDSVLVNGRLFRSTFEASLLRHTSVSAEGRQVIMRTDSLGRVLQQEMQGVAPFDYTYDSNGLLTAVTQGGRTWTYGYDALGRLASMTDPLSRTDSLYYDAADRLVRQVLPNGSEILYGYDAAGNLTSLTPPDRPAHIFDYTAVHLDSVYAPPSAGAGNWATEYRYDLDRQLTQVLRPDGQGIGLAYDAAGRLDAVTTPAGAYSYGYSALTGQLESVTAPGGGTLSYTYDGFLPRGVTWSGAVSGTVTVRYDNNFWVTAQRVNGDSIPFGYDNDGLLTSAGALSIARSPQNGLITGSTLGGLATRWTYNGFGEVASDTARHGGTVLYRNTYTRDDLGRITGKVITIESVTTTYAFAYDSIGRLVEVTRDGSPVESYTYDSNGNRLSFTGPGGTLVGSYDDQDRLLSYGDATYEYTANGELTSRTTPAGTTTYDYDVLGNLRSVALPDGTEVEYVIDGQNRRVGKRVNGALVQGFLYQDQLNPVAELDGSGQVLSRFVYGTRSHVPDYMIKGGVTYRIVTDQLGSVRLVVNTSTGAIAQRIDYDSFGRVTQDSNAEFQPFGFAGGIQDTHTGLVRFGARDYDAYTGRWTAKDPILFAGGSSNLYAYALEDPVNWLDPDGQQALAGAVIGGALELGMQLWQNGGQLQCVNWGRVGGAVVMGAVGGGILRAVRAARSASFFDDVARVGPIKTDPFHRFPTQVASFERAGTVTRFPNGYSQLDIPGSYLGRDGVFEIGKQAGQITHWFFRPLP